MVRIDEVFNVKYGNQFDFSKMFILDGLDYGINFINRSAQNNGFAAKVDMYNDVEPFEAGLITVALGGSILSSFIQPDPFYTAQNIKVLNPRMELSENEKLYYCWAIEKNRFRYSTFGREANSTFNGIMVPEPSEIPDEVKYYSADNVFINSSVNNNRVHLNINQWKPFRLDYLFDIYTSKDQTLTDSSEGDIPYISSTQLRNGISDFISGFPTHDRNTITVARNGSVGSAFFHDYGYCASPDDIRVLKPKFNMNQYLGVFFTTLIEKEKFRYAYGRKFGTKRMKQTIIKLPVNSNGEPDFTYIESYIKSLPYSASL